MSVHILWSVPRGDGLPLDLSIGLDIFFNLLLCLLQELVLAITVILVFMSIIVSVFCILILHAVSHIRCTIYIWTTLVFILRVDKLIVFSVAFS